VQFVVAIELIRVHDSHVHDDNEAGNCGGIDEDTICSGFFAVSILRVIKIPDVIPSSEIGTFPLSGNRFSGKPIEKTAILFSFSEPIAADITVFVKIAVFTSTNEQLVSISNIAFARVFATAHLILIENGALYRFCFTCALVSEKAFFRLRTLYVTN
jgi:hypothetical protein